MSVSISVMRQIDAGGNQLRLAWCQAGGRFPSTLLCDVEGVVHRLLSLLSGGETLLGVVEFDVEQGILEDDLLGVIRVFDIGGERVAVGGLDIRTPMAKLNTVWIVADVEERRRRYAGNEGLPEAVTQAGAEDHGGHVGVTLGAITGGGAGPVGSGGDHDAAVR